ncbi:epoxide hydrolase [Colletotrichum sublineola]|uniref:Putative epoxide hydrolase n=1 Tax=Colletotrichum sublineola TaxID=1173701 RepID=A0A066XTD1_COLSU|nr:epoxide hydrolase [Colletotrichum sublineola]KDN70969.1 putative epoxide hydrolase [Colletotrichum sublineola]
MAQAFGDLPSGVVKTPEKFTLRVPDQDLDEFKQLLQLSKIGPETWYNQQERDRGRYGITRDWLIGAKDAWLKFDWRKQEDRINSFPNFKAKVESAMGTVDIHFTALFSKRKDAVPIAFMHGWPGSFLEFFPILDLLVKKYPTPDSLPYHVIVPSLPGYGPSADSVPVDKEPSLQEAAEALHQMMLDLGFSGYAVQGGDLGSLISRYMSLHKECKAFHLNMLMTEADGSSELTQQDLEQLQRSAEWSRRGTSYSMSHGLRTATIGLALSASPLALLAWIGEKYLEWVDSRYPLQMEVILEVVSLYWFTSTFPRCIYPYVQRVEDRLAGKSGYIPTSKETPMGYSIFRYDLIFAPKPWAEKAYPNLKFCRIHEEGGHFAALERPEALLQDVEDFLKPVQVLET